MTFDQMINYDIISNLFFIILIILYIIFDKNSKKIQISDILVMVILVIVSALRCNVGSDYYNYYLRYNYATMNFSDIFEAISSGTEFGFNTLIYIVKQTITFEYAIFWVIALLLYPTMVYFLRKNTQKPSLGISVFLLMGFYSISNNIMRQYIAMLILFIAFLLLIKGKKLTYIILNILAYSFHPTSIIAGILMAISLKIKPTIKNLVISVCLGSLFLILLNTIGPTVISNISFLRKYSVYIGNTNFTSMIKENLYVVGTVIIYFIFTLQFIKNKEIIKEESESNYKLISLFIIALPISIIAVGCWPINRMALYMYQYVILLIPALLKIKSKEKIKNKYILIMFCLMIVWSMFFTIFSGENEYYQYKTYYDTYPMRY